MDKKAIKVGIDLDQYTADNEYLRIICHLLDPTHEIHLITNRVEKKRSEMMEALEKHSIKFSQLVLTENKAAYLLKQGIRIEVGE